MPLLPRLRMRNFLTRCLHSMDKQKELWYIQLIAHSHSFSKFCASQAGIHSPMYTRWFSGSTHPPHVHCISDPGSVLGQYQEGCHRRYPIYCQWWIHSWSKSLQSWCLCQHPEQVVGLWLPVNNTFLVAILYSRYRQNLPQASFYYIL